MTEPLVKTIDEASERMGRPFTRDFLKAHLDEIPHVRVGEGRGRGGRVGFTDEQMAEIVRMYTVDPTPVRTTSGPITRRRAS